MDGGKKRTQNNHDGKKVNTESGKKSGKNARNNPE